MTTPESPIAPGYEPSDASPRVLIASGALLAIGIVSCLLVAALIYRPRPVDRATHPEMSFRHGAENESTIARDWRTQDNLVKEHLTTYGWSDRKAGMVRIPVERAMDLMVRDAAASAEESR